MTDVLLEHGTQLSRLKPANIVQAAEADIRLRDRKRADEADADRPYTFSRHHVRRATGAAHLIALAYFEPDFGTNKRSSLIIYHDRELLHQTLIELLTPMEA
jgi:hypothetical protein